MNHLQSAVMGLVQGLTEFLPVSSSGHLALAGSLLDPDESPDLAFGVVLHLGTLAAVFVVLRSEVRALCGGLPLLLRPRAWRSAWEESPGFRNLILLIPATLPAALVGIFLEDRIEAAFTNPRLVAVMLLVTAAILAAATLAGRRRRHPERRLGTGAALAMGLAQAVAIVPGISRSGSTLSAGLLGGVERQETANFAFLMAIPVILGAALLESRHIAALGDLSVLGVGFGTAFLSGWASLVLLIGLLRRGRLWWFCPYLIAISSGYLIFGPR